MAVITQTRRYVFQSVHSLVAFQEGKHGHHFYLELTFSGGAEKLALADQCYREFIEPMLNGREVAIHPPTGENIVEWIHQELLHSPIGASLLAVALQETDKNRYISSKSEARFV